MNKEVKEDVKTEMKTEMKTEVNAEVKQGGWSPEEDEILVEGHAK